MGRLLFCLFVALPFAAIALNHDSISALFMIVWTVVVIPLSMLRGLDYLRIKKRPSTAETLLKIPFLLLGLLSIGMGAAIIAWCLTNVFIKLLPEYSGETNIIALLIDGFGIASLLIAFGAYLLRLCAGRERAPFHSED